MILTDFLCCEHDITWDYAKQCGVAHGVIRLPEEDFDVTNVTHWNSVYDKFSSFGIKPVVIEPMPNHIHNHIKSGDSKRDESIEKVIKMLPIMSKLDIRTICFNFMAYVGWTRTTSKINERGNALVSGFDINEYNKTNDIISEKQLWDNYTYFIKAIIPYAQKYGIKLALHPDDPPLDKLGNVSRIMTSYENINKAINIVQSDMLGVTFCQATYLMMGENIYDIIPKLSEKIFFVHFRNVTGNKYKFNETFHDNGDINMYKILKLYKDCDINVPIRVDHVPLMSGEKQGTTGYGALGRLFAIGYLKGLLESLL